MSNKSLFSIGEVAAAIGITRKIILNYEAKGLITPDQKDGSTGNRYYTIDTFTRIRTIRIFQDLGLSLDEVREYLIGATDLQPIITKLEKMRDELNLTIEKLKERSIAHNNTIKEITVESQTIYCRSYKSNSIADKTNLLRNTALEAMRSYGTDTTKRMYFIEYSIKTPDDLSFCVAVPPESKGEHIRNIPLMKAISIFHHGAYEDLSKTRNFLFKYAEDNNIKLSGVFRHLYLEGPPQHKEPSKFITQIIALIEE